jgi:hypothetical protein
VNSFFKIQDRIDGLHLFVLAIGMILLLFITLGFFSKKEASTIILRKIIWYEDLSTYLLHRQINFTLLPYPITFVLSFESVNFSFTKKKVSLGLHLSNSSYIAPLTKQCKGKTFTTRSQTERTRMVESPKKLIFIYPLHL